MNCAVKKGFFTLRDCLVATDASCQVCGRPCCDEHARLRDGRALCIECFHKDATVTGPTEDDTWTYAYRRQFYLRSGYHPFYSGSHPDPYYDAYDMRAFAVEGHEVDDDDEAAALEDS